MRTFREKITHLGAIGAAALIGVAGLGTAALVTATPASAQAVTVTQNWATYSALTGYGVQQTTSVITPSATSVDVGSTFTFTSAPPSQSVPTSQSIADINYITGTNEIYPLPAGVSTAPADVVLTPGTASYTGGLGQTCTSAGVCTPLAASGTFPITATYCTAAGAGCTATAAPTANFLGSTSFPYIEIGLAGQVPGGALLTQTPTTIQLKATTAGPINLTQSEFQTQANVNILALSVYNDTLPITGYPTSTTPATVVSTVQPPLIAPLVVGSITALLTPQTVSFTSTAPTSATVGGATYTPTATATSGLPVTITVATASASVCSISAGVVSFTGAGTCTLDANQAGNATYSAAPQVTQSFTVSSAVTGKVPGAPTHVVATAGNASAKLTWKAPASNGGSAITGYLITPYLWGRAQKAIKVGNVTSFTVTGLYNWNLYNFTVAAINGVGTGSASAPSNFVIPPIFTFWF